MDTHAHKHEGIAGTKPRNHDSNLFIPVWRSAGKLKLFILNQLDSWRREKANLGGTFEPSRNPKNSFPTQVKLNRWS
eukprot:316071-Rhodomonas_salina.3